MERPDFFTLHNGDKAKLPFTDKEYQNRVNGLREAMSKNNLDMIILTSMNYHSLIRSIKIELMD